MAVEVGAEFNTYEDLTNAIRAYESANYVNLIIRDTRKVESAAKRNQRKCYNTAIKYSDISYCCTYGGKKYVSHSTGKRNHKTSKQACPFSLKVRATVDGQRLFVREMCCLHNHEISEAEFRLHPKQRKLDVGSQEEIANLLSMEPDKKLLRAKLMQITGKVILMKDIHNIKTRLVNPKLKLRLSRKVSIEKEDAPVSNCNLELGESEVQISCDLQQQDQALTDLHLPLAHLTGPQMAISDQHVNQQTLNEPSGAQHCFIENQCYPQPSDMYSVNIPSYHPDYGLASQPFQADAQGIPGNILPSVEARQVAASNPFHQWATMDDISRTNLPEENYETIATLTFNEPQNEILLSNEARASMSCTVQVPELSNTSLLKAPNLPENHKYAQDPQASKIKRRMGKEQSKEGERKKKKSSVQEDKNNTMKKYLQQATVNLYFNERLKSPGNKLLKSFKQRASAEFKMSECQFHEMLKPLSWLFGKWRSEDGKGEYPTITEFTYGEEAEFFPIGMKPIIEYKFYSWKPDNKMQLHRETGFIRIKPESNHIAFMAAHNLGVVEIQEGEVQGQTLTVQTTSLGRTSFNKPPEVKSVRRTLKRNGNDLEQVIEMETNKTEMCQHLKITFKKVN